MSIDKNNIKYKSIFMICDKPQYSEKSLPIGYHFDKFNDGDEIHWAEICASSGEFDTKENALNYFKDAYGKNSDLLKERCYFVKDNNDIAVATCMAWVNMEEWDKIPCLHWFSTAKEHQDKGIGNALLDIVLHRFEDYNELPILLHTQTTSFNAVLMYQKRGFKIIKNQFYPGLKNQYFGAMAVLKSILSKNVFTKLKSESIRIQKIKN